MTERRHTQPVGAALAGWTPRPSPPRTPMRGRFCILEPLAAGRHASDLHAAHAHASDDRDWTYLPHEKPTERRAFDAWCERLACSRDPMHHAIIDRATGRAAGSAAFLRVDTDNGVIEISAIIFSPLLQRRAAGSEAIYLMMRRAFDELGYRRCEWKCDVLNGPSRAAALRYGFQFEGVFRQAVVVKRRSRDTAWYSVIDTEWPVVRNAFERWLLPGNFDPLGRQVRRLAELRSPGQAPSPACEP